MTNHKVSAPLQLQKLRRVTWQSAKDEISRLPPS